MAFVEAQECIDYIHDKLDLSKGTIGVTAVVTAGEDELLFDLPAIVITDGELIRRIEGTQLYSEIINIDMWVYHADMNIDRRKRNREDRDMCTRIVTELHADYTLGGNIVHGFVTNETPGSLLSPRGRSVVATRLQWIGTMRTPMVRS